MISYPMTCFICQNTFDVSEKSPEYQMVKRNFHGKHACQTCKEAIEKDAATVTGINREMLEALDTLGIDAHIDRPTFT